MCPQSSPNLGQVNCNSCGTVHTFYQCPSLAGMNSEAQKVYFHAQALEKHNAKRTQYMVDQVRADDEYSGSDQDVQEDQEDYSAANDNMANWTREDWIDYPKWFFCTKPQIGFSVRQTLSSMRLCLNPFTLEPRSTSETS